MRVNELFYSLQGEGYYAGTAAFFIRFSGCNLNCSFCDTTHLQPSIEMNENEIVAQAARCPAAHVVLTGGEPALQLTPMLLQLLHGAGKFVQVETNGTIPLPDEGIDWVTCSPKLSPEDIRLAHVDELKLLFYPEVDPERYVHINARIFTLQPLDTGDVVLNERLLREAVAYVKEHPRWRLSLQLHKLIGLR